MKNKDDIIIGIATVVTVICAILSIVTISSDVTIRNYQKGLTEKSETVVIDGTAYELKAEKIK